MKRKKHTPQQILEKLRAVDVELSQGRTFVEIARQLEVSEQTLHRRAATSTAA
jgi:transposase-like protein